MSILRCSSLQDFLYANIAYILRDIPWILDLSVLEDGQINLC